MKICPMCGELLSYNSYFGAYICENCGWEDNTKAKLRDNISRGNLLLREDFEKEFFSSLKRA